MATDQVKLTAKQSLEHNRKGRQRNLSTYWMMIMPKAAEKHRPKRKQQKDDAIKKSTKNKNDNTTTSPAPEQPAVQLEVSSLKQKLAMASDVICGRVNIPQNEPVQNNKAGYSPHNPPVVVLTDGTNISRCKGCTKKITTEERKYPNMWYSGKKA